VCGRDVLEIRHYYCGDPRSSYRSIVGVQRVALSALWPRENLGYGQPGLLGQPRYKRTSRRRAGPRPRQTSQAFITRRSRARRNAHSRTRRSWSGRTNGLGSVHDPAQHARALGASVVTESAKGRERAHRYIVAWPRSIPKEQSRISSPREDLCESCSLCTNWSARLTS